MISIFIILAIVSIGFFFYHRSQNYDGEYNLKGKYKNINPVKHNVFKIFFIKFLVLLVYGFPGDMFSYTITDSWVGISFIRMLAFFMFFELFQPYVVSQI